MALAVVVALGVGGYLHIVTPYHTGAVSMYSWVYSGEPVLGFTYFAPLVQVADQYDTRLPVFFASGIGIALVLSIMRMRYAWWPLAPLGFALSGSWSMIVFWFPFLVAWLLKTTIVRYGGWRTYSRLRPFFLGLILGEFSQAVIWATSGGCRRPSFRGDNLDGLVMRPL